MGRTSPQNLVVLVLSCYNTGTFSQGDYLVFVVSGGTTVVTFENFMSKNKKFLVRVLILLLIKSKFHKQNKSIFKREKTKKKGKQKTNL